MATYYVDNAGTNGGAGTSPGAGAWQTCAHVNSQTFAADDQIIFTAGQTFTGPLTITNSGTSGHYICIGTGRLTGSTAGTTRTAQSNPAVITCPDGGNGINLNDCEYVSIDNLSVTGTGVNTSTGVTTSTGMGISVASTQTTNKLNGVRITACSVTGCKNGIWVHTDNVSHKGYAGLQCWGCVMHANGQVGFLMWNNPFATGSKTQNSDVYVGYCQVYDHPGFPGGSGVGWLGEGITIRNCTTGLVEYCTAHDINIIGDQNPSGGTSGFDVTLADGITFQFCEAYNIYARQTLSGGPIDGVGIDFETGATNCLVQYSYFHDCDGAGYLNGAALSLAATGNVVRFCIFARNAANQQSEWHMFGGSAASDTTFYNNTVYATHGDVYTNVGSVTSTDNLSNNILVSAAGAFIANGTILAANVHGNIYYAIGGGGFKFKPSGTTYTALSTMRADGYEVLSAVNYGVNQDPLFSSPTSGTGVGFLPGANVSTMTYFDPAITSPAISTSGVGVDISPFVTLVQDFHGVSTSGHGANVGAVIPQASAGNIRLPIRF